jgi:hypothetical protein
MAPDHFESRDNSGCVIRFRPRMGTSRQSHRGMGPIGTYGPDYSPVPDLAKYEYRESDDDYRHRMIVNALALAFTSLLILASAWIAHTMMAQA